MGVRVVTEADGDPGELLNHLEVGFHLRARLKLGHAPGVRLVLPDLLQVKGLEGAFVVLLKDRVPASDEVVD